MSTATRTTEETVSQAIVTQIGAPAASPVFGEPSILTANCYFWSPATTASSRRRNETRHIATVAAWLHSLGFATIVGDTTVSASGHGLAVEFSYSESCKNVYKHLSVTRAGRRSNITAIRKLIR